MIFPWVWVCMQNNGVTPMPSYCSISGRRYSSGHQHKAKFGGKLSALHRLKVLKLRHNMLCMSGFLTPMTCYFNFYVWYICHLGVSLSLDRRDVWTHGQIKRRCWRQLKRQNSSDRKFSHEKRGPSDYVTNGREAEQRIEWNGWDISITATPRKMDLMMRGILRLPTLVRR